MSFARLSFATSGLLPARSDGPVGPSPLEDGLYVNLAEFSGLGSG
jgi:hypothetical protein